MILLCRSILVVTSSQADYLVSIVNSEGSHNYNVAIYVYVIVDRCKLR